MLIPYIPHTIIGHDYSEYSSAMFLTNVTLGIPLPPEHCVSSCDVALVVYYVQTVFSKLGEFCLISVCVCVYVFSISDTYTCAELGEE